MIGVAEGERQVGVGAPSPARGIRLGDAVDDEIAASIGVVAKVPDVEMT